MPNQADFPHVEVAVTLIVRGEFLLAVYNPRWAAFTLPMTKRRIHQDPNIAPAHREEDWINAGARAAAEYLGRTLTALEELPVEVPPYQQSDRTGEWKHYSFRVFRCPFEASDRIRPDAVIEWLTRDQFLDEERRPISPTARHILKLI